MRRKYSGKYPKRIHTVYGMGAGKIGVMLNNGERVNFTAREMGLRTPKPGETIAEARKKGAAEYERNYGKKLVMTKNPKRRVVAKKKKRKATPAQLKALAKGRAVMAAKRGRVKRNPIAKRSIGAKKWVVYSKTDGGKGPALSYHKTKALAEKRAASAPANYGVMSHSEFIKPTRKRVTKVARNPVRKRKAFGKRRGTYLIGVVFEGGRETHYYYNGTAFKNDKKEAVIFPTVAAAKKQAERLKLNLPHRISHLTSQAA